MTRNHRLTWFLTLTTTAALWLGCREKPSPEDATPAPGPSASAAPELARAEVHPKGDAARGEALTQAFECGRCHDGAELVQSPLEQHCGHCHMDIMNGTFKAPKTELAKWQPVVEPYRDIPSLQSSAQRFKASWLASFLTAPHDLRPHLKQSMPRLALTEEQATDIAAFLTKGAPAPAQKDPLAGGDLAKGRALMEQKGCPSCHTMTGVPAFATQPDAKSADERTRRGVLLAPDLRFARERMPRESAIRWIRDPSSIKKSTLMPSTSLSEQEARDIAAYVFDTPLEAAPKRAVPERLAVLSRPVRYQEVFDEVFSKTCVHCHGDPQVARGDGGPGNTGGFGFKPRRLNLASYSALLSGMVDTEGERVSAFKPTADGTPRLVAALLARQAEEAGAKPGEVRGMPLSLPALSSEQVQLVESWIAQGRPR
ncbi:MAG: c-type cytochrome [Polyangiaceae bacterium]|nr:c-type cytochrome [Polyangiaceae bacterium]